MPIALSLYHCCSAVAALLQRCCSAVTVLLQCCCSAVAVLLQRFQLFPALLQQPCISATIAVQQRPCWVGCRGAGPTVLEFASTGARVTHMEGGFDSSCAEEGSKKYTYRRYTTNIQTCTHMIYMYMYTYIHTHTNTRTRTNT